MSSQNIIWQSVKRHILMDNRSLTLRLPFSQSLIHKVRSDEFSHEPSSKTMAPERDVRTSTTCEHAPPILALDWLITLPSIRHPPHTSTSAVLLCCLESSAMAKCNSSALVRKKKSKLSITFSVMWRSPGAGPLLRKCVFPGTRTRFLSSARKNRHAAVGRRSAYCQSGNWMACQA